MRLPLAVLALTSPVVAFAQNNGSYVAPGRPIVSVTSRQHNLQHYRREAARLNVDYRAALARGGGELTAGQKSSFATRWDVLATGMRQNGIASLY